MLRELTQGTARHRFSLVYASTSHTYGFPLTRATARGDRNAQLELHAAVTSCWGRHKRKYGYNWPEGWRIDLVRFGWFKAVLIPSDSLCLTAITPLQHGASVSRTLNLSVRTDSGRSSTKKSKFQRPMLLILKALRTGNVCPGPALPCHLRRFSLAA
jgi:hypothetical protein